MLFLQKLYLKGINHGCAVKNVFFILNVTAWHSSVSPIGSQGRKSGASSVSSEVSSSSSKWKSTFSPISDPKPTLPDLRQGGSPFGMGMSRGAGGGTDSDSDQKQQRRVERERERSEAYGNPKGFLGSEASNRSASLSERPQQKQKLREWELKAVSGLASQNLFISAATSGGILSGKVGGATTVSSASSVGQYFPLGGASVLQSLFGAQTSSPATSGAPRLVNGHSALGSFSSAGLAGGAAGGELSFQYLLFLIGSVRIEFGSSIWSVFKVSVSPVLSAFIRAAFCAAEPQAVFAQAKATHP